ncbi:MAG: EamA family transporter RarD [Leucobacter sp.]
MLGPDAAGKLRKGLGFGVSAYFLWGVLPLYFVLLTPLNPFEIVAWRILLTLIFCGLLLTVMRQWAQTAALLRDRKVLLKLTAAGAVIYVNWQVFVIASTSGHVVDASLGYFLNPVVTVLLAVLFARERLTVMQWIAIGTTAVAFVIIAIGYGTFPWIAMILALSFGLYGYFKSSVGGGVPALPGLFVESMVLTPLSLVILAVVGSTFGLSVLHADAFTIGMLGLVGAATAIPLIFFAAAARRIPLKVLGFLQYLAPSIMFFIGWLALDEHVPPARWLGFALVWTALVLLSIDSLRRARQRRHVLPVAPLT